MKDRLIVFARKYPIVFILAACIIYFSASSPVFLTSQNLMNILLQVSIIGIISIGMTLILINANIDLSVGSILAFSAALAMGLQTYGLLFSIIACLAAGTLIGALNGFLVAKAKINSFIVTLGAMMGVRGLVYIYTQERPIVGTERALIDFGSSSVGPIPVIALIFVLMLIAAELVLRYTTHGRNAIAVGGNYEAAENAGIKVERHVFYNFMFIGFTAALAGLLLVSRTNSATAFLGTNYELMVISAVVLGGTKLTGGYGSMLNTFGGVLVIGMIQNGMNLLNVHAYYSMLIMGLILILVVFIDTRFKAPGNA